MKCTNILLLPVLSGCISPGIRLDVQDTDAPVAVDTAGVDDPVETDDPVDTGDTEDTQDTQDTQDTSHTGDGMTNIGLREMRGEYLWFDSSIALRMNTKTEEGGDLNEFSMVLNPLGSWGVGVTLAPYNAETRGLFFGGEEIELFSGNGALMTLQIVEVVNQQAEFTVRLYNVKVDSDGDKNLCAVREFAPPDWSQYPSISELVDGFQLLVLHRQVGEPSSSLTLLLQRTDTDSPEPIISKALFTEVTANATPHEDCAGDPGYLTSHLIFGGQTHIEANYSSRRNMVQPQPLRARVDNLMLFTTEFFVELGNNTPSAIGFHPDNVQSASDANDIDGWGWWPFDLSDDQMGDFHFVRDETLQMQSQGMSNFFIVGNPEYNEIDSAGASAYYYNENTHALSGQ